MPNPQKSLITALICWLTACGAIDPYFEKFDRIAIGETRQNAIEQLGRPASTNSFAMPMISLEELLWRAPLNERVYLLFLINNRVAGKTVLQ